MCTWCLCPWTEAAMPVVMTGLNTLVITDEWFIGTARPPPTMVGRTMLTAGLTCCWTSGR